MSTEEKPKNCPFCGSEVKFIEANRPWLQCQNDDCYWYHFRFCMPPNEYKAELLRKWNTRVETKEED